MHRSNLARLEDGRYQVTERLQNLIEFEERNLATGAFPGGFDLIFCRNVLIYFDDDAKDDVLRRLVRSLNPGAFLFVGYSESLRDVEGLTLVQSGECSVYRRTSERIAPQLTPAIQEAPQERAVRTPNPPSSALQVMLKGEYQDGKRLASELDAALAKPTQKIVVNFDGADFLGPETADVLRQMRAAALSKGIAVHWQAARAGHLRFLRRHELEPIGAPSVETEQQTGDVP